MDASSREAIPGSQMRILIAPGQCLTDDLVLIRAGEMSQQPLASLFENECQKASPFQAPPGVQREDLDRDLQDTGTQLSQPRSSQDAAVPSAQQSISGTEGTQSEV
jgi:hypothetical protein